MVDEVFLLCIPWQVLIKLDPGHFTSHPLPPALYDVGHVMQHSPSNATPHPAQMQHCLLYATPTPFLHCVFAFGWDWQHTQVSVYHTLSCATPIMWAPNTPTHVVDATPVVLSHIGHLGHVKSCISTYQRRSAQLPTWF